MKGGRRRIQATGTLNVNIIKIDDTLFEWLEGDNFTLANLASTLGIDIDHEAKATVTIEIVKGLCEVCGKNITTGDKLCDTCGKMICTECANTDRTGIYCPTCNNQKRRQSATL